jgi:xylose isomerase
VQGLAERDDRGRYITIIDEYRPLKAKKKTLKIVPKPVDTPKRKYEKKAVTGIGALLREKLENTPMPVVSEHTTQANRFVTLVRTKTPDDILKDMTVFQARELYDYLKKMFGG